MIVICKSEGRLRALIAPAFVDASAGLKVDIMKKREDVHHHLGGEVVEGHGGSGRRGGGNERTE